MRRFQSKCVRGLSRAALLAGAALVASPALAQSAGGGAQLEEVVVTAQKREQNLQDVPISITAITQETLKANRIVDIRDLNAVAPNVTVRTIQGGGSAALVVTRGLFTAGSALGSDKGLSQYIDGVYIQNTAASIFQLADVERIEILKGPQGTLFGRNATGGAINITTRNPSGQFGVHQELTAGNYSHWRSKTRVDLPQAGPLSASFTYVHSERNGDIKNLGAGTTWDFRAGNRGFRTSPNRLGDEDINAAFMSLKFDFSPDFELNYKLDWAENKYTPEANGLVFMSGLFAQIYATQTNPSLLTPITSGRPKAVNNWYTTPAKAYSSGHNITARWNVTDNLTIKNILSKRRSGTSNTWQLDGAGGLRVVPALAALGLPATLVGQPWAIINNTTHQNDRQWSEELQVNWSSKLLEVTAGYIHFDYKVAGGGYPGVPNTLILSPLVNFVVPARNYRETTVHTRSDALYAQVEGHVTSQLDVVAGYRITKDKKQGSDNSAQDSTGASLTLPIKYSKARPTYLIGVNFHPMDGILTYAKYSTGFISGGQIASHSYTPETAKSYEAGIKADLLDRRLRSNLALFHVKYGDLQLTTGGTRVIPPINASVVLANAGDAKAKGLEWENTFLPMRGLTLTGNLGYTHFKYITVEPFVGTLATYLPTHRPKWTGNVAAQYETPEVFADGHMVFRVDVNYTGKTRLVSTNTPIAQTYGVVGASWIVNGRVALADFDLAGGKATAAVWGRNILNSKKLLNMTPLEFGAFLGNAYAAQYERARTFGVDLTMDF